MSNEQQKAKELAILLTAFAEGKQLQFLNDDGYWCDYQATIKDIVEEFLYLDNVQIRIKPETKRIALTMQDMIDRELSGKTMRLNVMELILAWNHNFVTTAGNTYGYNYLLANEFTFLDGTPFYKEVECE